MFWSKFIFLELIPYVTIIVLNALIVKQILKSYNFRRTFTKSTSRNEGQGQGQGQDQGQGSDQDKGQGQGQEGNNDFVRQKGRQIEQMEMEEREVIKHWIMFLENPNFINNVGLMNVFLMTKISKILLISFINLIFFLS